uniref:nitroreductase family protein n=1 Tax=Prevotella sp. TaxID=59823 RepID=UPI0040287C43
MRRNMILLSMLALMSTSCLAQNSIVLPKPSMDNKVTLMQALQSRHSAREYADKQIPDDVLSTVLWAACGINRPSEGKITAPSAINAQDIQVYVVRKDGTYLYQPKDNSLQKVSSKDLRSAVAGRQSFAASAPVSLVLVSNHNKFPQQIPNEAKVRMGVVDAGYVSENICLACSALGLNTVPRMTMDTETLKKELSLDDNYDLVLNSQIGYPKE